LLLLLFPIGWGNQALLASDNDNIIVLQDGVETYDLLKHITLSTSDNEDDYARLWDEGSREYKFDLIHPGDTAIYLRFAVSNPSQEATPLRFSTFFLDQVIVSHLEGDIYVVHNKTDGYLVPPSERSYPFTQTSITEISIPANKTRFFKLKLVNTSPIGRVSLLPSFKMGFKAYTPVGFDQWYGNSMLFNYFSCGIILIVLLYNIGIYIRTKERDFAALCYYNFGFLSWIVVFSGFLISSGIVSDLYIERVIRNTTPYFLMVTGYGLFGIVFLNLSKTLPLASRLVKLCMVLYTLSLTMYFIGFVQSSSLFQQAISLLLIVILFAAGVIIALKNENPLAKYFVVGSAIILISHAAYLYIFNEPDINYLFGHGLMQVGFILELVIFSILTSTKMGMIKKQNLRLITEKTELSNEKRNVEAELERKNRELMSYVMLQVQKQNELKAIKNEISDSINGKGQDLTGRLDQVMKNSNNWDTFKVYFENVHPSFLDALASSYPDLTNNELRLCAFLRMGLSTKEIASLQGVSTRAVEKAKERLAKKLNVRIAEISKTIMATHSLN